MATDNVVDIGVDENMEINITARGDLEPVTGRRAFEQEIMIRVTEQLYGSVGALDRETTRELRRTTIRDVAHKMDAIDSIQTFQISYPKDKQNIIEVEIVYDTADNLTFEVA
jgi:hypothetical protein